MYYSPFFYNDEDISGEEMILMKYKIIKDFSGSPDGMVALNFNQGDEINHDDLGDDLAEVALGEKWIKVVKEKAAEILEMDSERLIALLEAIGTLQQENKAHWTNNGDPEVKALKEMVSGKLYGAERDFAWNVYQTSEHEIDDEQRMESLVQAIDVLSTDNAGDFIEVSGKPSIVALETITGGSVAGVERDVAWIAFSAKESGSDEPASGESE